jgi:hypothetical protein
LYIDEQVGRRRLWPPSHRCSRLIYRLSKTNASSIFWPSADVPFVVMAMVLPSRSEDLMRRSPRMTSKFIAALLLLVAWVGLPLAAGLTATKAEEVGVSSERLQRLHDTIQHHIDAHDFSGAVTLVARKGRLVQFEAQE